MDRKYHRDMPLHEAMYYVYEAKRSAESVPGVGKKTYMHVLAYNPISIGTDVHTFEEEQELATLKAQFDIFSRKPFGIEECQGHLLDTASFWPRAKGR